MLLVTSLFRPHYSFRPPANVSHSGRMLGSDANTSSRPSRVSTPVFPASYALNSYVSHVRSAYRRQKHARLRRELHALSLRQRERGQLRRALQVVVVLEVAKRRPHGLRVVLHHEQLHQVEETLFGDALRGGVQTLRAALLLQETLQVGDLRGCHARVEAGELEVVQLRVAQRERATAVEHAEDAAENTLERVAEGLGGRGG